MTDSFRAVAAEPRSGPDAASVELNQARATVEALHAGPMPVPVTALQAVTGVAEEWPPQPRAALHTISLPPLPRTITLPALPRSIVLPRGVALPGFGRHALPRPRQMVTFMLGAI